MNYPEVQLALLPPLPAPYNLPIILWFWFREFHSFLLTNHSTRRPALPHHLLNNFMRLPALFMANYWRFSWNEQQVVWDLQCFDVSEKRRENWQWQRGENNLYFCSHFYSTDGSTNFIYRWINRGKLVIKKKTITFHIFVIKKCKTYCI